MTEDVPHVMLTYEPEGTDIDFHFVKSHAVFTNDPKKTKILPEPKLPTGKVQLTPNYKSYKKKAADNNLKIKYLVRGVTQDQVTEGDKVKALFDWLTTEDVEQSVYDQTANFSLVKFHLRKIQDRMNSYAAFFSLLCFYAQIPCVIIRGFVKGSKYLSIGKPLKKEHLREWNAVCINNEWHLVDTFWGARTQYRMVQDPWFLFPDPNELIFSHYPEDPLWQLVDNQISKVKFEELAFLKPRFFKMQLDAKSAEQCCLQAKDGEIVINLKMNTSQPENQFFKCVTSKKVTEDGTNNKHYVPVVLPEKNVQLDFTHKHVKAENGDDNSEYDKCEIDDEDGNNKDGESCVQLDFTHKHVKAENGDDNSEYDKCEIDDEDGNNKDGESSALMEQTDLSVTVRFPQEGIYKLEIIGYERQDTDKLYAGPKEVEEEKYDWVAIYVVNVNHVPNWLVFFPLEPVIGWGPNPNLLKCGLQAVFPKSGTFQCFPEEIHMKFRIIKNPPTKNIHLRYKIKKTKTDDHEQEHDEMSEDFVPSGNKLTVFIPPLEIGESVIEIYAKLDQTDKGNICNFKALCVERPIDLTYEEEQHYITELENAMKRRKIPELTAVTQEIKQKKIHTYRSIRRKFCDACSLQKRLLQYEKSIQDIQQVDNKIIQYVKSLNNPDPGIVDIMSATFILLGKDKRVTNSWEEMRKEMKISGGKDALKYQIQNLDIDTLDHQTVQRAKKAIGNLDVAKTIEKSKEVASFAKWVESIIITFND